MTDNGPDLFTVQQYPAVPVLTLSELNAAIKDTFESAFPETLWVVAEISEIRCNAKGHCYLELVEKRGETTTAQLRANIWARTFSSIVSSFGKATGESLKQGMKVLLRVNITFHEVYGLSLNIRDIDPTYSLGEMARKKREVIERLTREGLINLNRQIPMPLVLQRIAVISSSTAAGYGDFINHLEDNPYGYKIFHALHQSIMQGQEAVASIISALRQVRAHNKRYDALVIVRGGGSQIDLSCFDAFDLAAEVARFPLPVITGIGHERDDTAADLVAHTKLKTPTAVAEFLLAKMADFEERVTEAQSILIYRVKESIGSEDHRLRHLAQHCRQIVRDRFAGEIKRIEIGLHKLIHGTTQIIDSQNDSLKLDMGRISGGSNILLRQQENRITHSGQAIRLLDPINVLKRGYSITYLHNKAVMDGADLHEGDIIKTRVYKGSVRSKVEAVDVEK